MESKIEGILNELHEQSIETKSKALTKLITEVIADKAAIQVLQKKGASQILEEICFVDEDPSFKRKVLSLKKLLDLKSATCEDPKEEDNAYMLHSLLCMIQNPKISSHVLPTLEKFVKSVELTPSLLKNSSFVANMELALCAAQSTPEVFKRLLGIVRVVCSKKESAAEWCLLAKALANLSDSVDEEASFLIQALIHRYFVPTLFNIVKDPAQHQQQFTIPEALLPPFTHPPTLAQSSADEEALKPTSSVVKSLMPEAVLLTDSVSTQSFMDRTMKALHTMESSSSSRSSICSALQALVETLPQIDYCGMCELFEHNLVLLLAKSLHLAVATLDSHANDHSCSASSSTTPSASASSSSSTAIVLPSVISIIKLSLTVTQHLLRRFFSVIPTIAESTIPSDIVSVLLAAHPYSADNALCASNIPVLCLGTLEVMVQRNYSKHRTNQPIIQTLLNKHVADGILIMLDSPILNVAQHAISALSQLTCSMYDSCVVVTKCKLLELAQHYGATDRLFAVYTRAIAEAKETTGKRNTDLNKLAISAVRQISFLHSCSPQPEKTQTILRDAVKCVGNKDANSSIFAHMLNDAATHPDNEKYIVTEEFWPIIKSVLTFFTDNACISIVISLLHRLWVIGSEATRNTISNEIRPLLIQHVKTGPATVEKQALYLIWSIDNKKYDFRPNLSCVIVEEEDLAIHGNLPEEVKRD
ncbi:uncharacterized protein MONOS_7664 [Monocercomonoides exilis]|uniref:uncharacterized protein n=1 Tax=Monocercomonoides exilis TaxID=2049356 RepID=UPI00355A792D|nr:hypothetical protein MONOS_7664 [Monocercomonoides exilis]|eukprot:MONOS_7664.1-p1 / transcript=MONOS_7664.1 / gene=MONOS_7664 / organism=Monocercomonoides_exilis_PA203 / gene_product=unspecified product / transcript_product=unspecified product / location=Mono_scaffold00267:63607-65952(-) / protein_length=703 / sequence_SO=supercontig / SO=protein_coding / is_pseudo=false